VNYISISKIGIKFGVSRNEIFIYFGQEGLIKKTGTKWELTVKGEKLGGIYRNYFGRYIAFPETANLDFINKTNLLTSNQQHIQKSDFTLKYLKINNESCFYLEDYYPSSRFSQDINSKMLLKFKDSDKEAIQFWSRKLISSAIIEKLSNVDIIIRVLGHDELSSLNKNSPLDKLCKLLAKEIPCSFNPSLLTKKRKNKSLKFLNKSNRSGELKNVYHFNKYDTKDFNILVLDDITTTGSTFKEISRSIKVNSPNANIYFLVLGRTVPNFSREASKTKDKLENNNSQASKNFPLIFFILFFLMLFFLIYYFN